ncbi:MAG: YajQ family cyclic di-GMP-binding protein [Deltaproteobacteria bacterium]|nr:YajQ family cyclic di-GMP-binding protein [Deltaproteobacteria bacterium]
MPSFDIVSKVNLPEVDNAFQQAKKEIDQRYDFKGTDTGVERVVNEKENGIKLKSSTEQRLEAARGIVVEKLAKRGISMRAIVYGKIEQSGKFHLQLLTFQAGLKPEKVKELVKFIKDSKIKVQAAIQGDAVRVSSKSRDELQETMKAVRANADKMEIDIGFENFRD